MQFPDFPDEARVWIYPLSRPLSNDEQTALTQRFSSFASDWTSHGRPVRGEAAVLHDQFLLLTAHIPGGDISGCGIDKAVHEVEAAVAEMGLDILPALAIFYRDDTGQLQAVGRGVFRKLVRAGTVDAYTTVFDPSVTLLADVRRGAFAQPAGKSWHGRLFRIPQPTS